MPTTEELLLRKRELLVQRKQALLAAQNPSFGAKDILPSLGRGVTSTLGFFSDVGDVMAQHPDSPVTAKVVGKGLGLLPNTQQIRGAIDKTVDFFGGEKGESVFSGGEGTLRGRALEFGGSGTTFVAGSLTKTAMQEGSKAFAKATARSLAESAAAGAGSFVGEEVGGTPGAFIGAFVPAGIKSAATGTVKVSLRGLGRERQKEMMTALKQAKVQGADSTLGSVSPVQRASTAERAFESIPGSHGPFLRAAERNATGLQKRLENLLGNSAYREETAGGHVASALKRRLDTFRTSSKKLYNDAEGMIKNRNALVSVDKTMQRLKQLSDEIPASEFDDIFNAVKAQDDVAGNLLVVMRKPNTSKILNAQGSPIKKPTSLSNGEAPWWVANHLRKVVGNQISLSSSIGDSSQGVLKRIYSALSKDVQEGAVRAGGVQAKNAFNKANNFWKKGRREADRLIDPMLRRDLQPELLFREVVGTALNKPSKLTLILKGMNPQQREYFAKTFIARLGNISDKTGTVVDNLWSPGRLLRNWERIPDSQKQELFKSTPELKRLGVALERYMRVLSKQKKSAGILANPSGTAGTGLAAATLQSALSSTGKIVTLGIGGAVAIANPIASLAAIGMAMGGANVGARLMTSDKFLLWLTKATQSPLKDLPKQIVRLNNLANDDPEFVEALDAFNTALALEIKALPTEEDK